MYWKIQKQISKTKKKERFNQIQQILLSNRDITNKNEVKAFLNPKNPRNITPKEVEFDLEQLKISLKRIKQAIFKKQEIVIFGDYDADGITATAILWETLHKLGANVLPFIPHREKHGYGLSIKAIDDLLKNKKPSLIITVDNGIVAFDAAEYISNLGIDLIITDHHVASTKLPKALSIIQTTKLAGAGVAWIFAKEIIEFISNQNQVSSLDTLDLATIGTIADQVPLTGSNRAIVKEGLVSLSQTKRVGLLELFSQAQFDPKTINSYHINFIIAPRINAMGRLADGMDSLRLLCTKNKKRARKLSVIIDDTNTSRKDLTYELLDLANNIVGKPKDKVIVVEHKDFHEGVIGLVAGKLTETYYKPSVVIGISDEISKASARSVRGVDIIKLIRKVDKHLVNAGGHPMAAGFTISTSKIDDFKKEFIKLSNQSIDNDLLSPGIEIETQINLSDISWELYELISKFEPFGVANKKPVFSLKNVKILEKYAIGKEKNHLKLILPSKIKNQTKIDALWFGKADKISNTPDSCDIAFTLEKNTWNDITSLQMMVKDIKTID